MRQEEIPSTQSRLAGLWVGAFTFKKLPFWKETNACNTMTFPLPASWSHQESGVTATAGSAESVYSRELSRSTSLHQQDREGPDLSFYGMKGSILYEWKRIT